MLGGDELAAYLARIGFQGRPRPDIDTLKAIHRAHAETIPWTSLDALFGRPTTPDPACAFDKLVTRGQGGWCYEMNGLLGAALEAIGFRVTRLAAGVAREFRGDWALGNHLMLLVDLNGPWIADVGLGTGLVEPVPLEEGEIAQGFMRFALARLDDGHWRFRGMPGLRPPSFDFTTDSADEMLLAERCAWLGSDKASPFRQNFTVQRYFPNRLETVAGPVRVTVSADGLRERRYEDFAEYRDMLAELFGIDEPELAAVWRNEPAPVPVPAIRPPQPRASSAAPGGA